MKKMKINAKTKIVTILAISYICLFIGIVGVGISGLKGNVMWGRPFIILAVLSFLGISRLYCLRLRCGEGAAKPIRRGKLFRAFVGLIICIGSISVISAFWAHNGALGAIYIIGTVAVVLLAVLDIAITVLLWYPLDLSTKSLKKGEAAIKDILS
jgi:hypothetical protein